MAKLTQTRLSQIQKELNNSIFTLMAFSIETGKSEKHIVTITFIDDPRFFISLSYEQRQSFSTDLLHTRTSDSREIMSLRQCPGDCVEVEREDISEFQYFVDAVKSWTGRVRSELSFVQLLDKSLSDFQTQLNARLNEHFEDPAAHFTKAEREEMCSKLAELQTQIESIATSVQSTQAEIAQMKATISNLVQATATMPRRSWVRAACGKIHEITLKMAASPSGQKLIANTIDQFLPPPK